MKWLRMGIVVLLAIGTTLSMSMTTAQAAPPPRTVLVGGHICLDAGSICVPEQPGVVDGVGQDAKVNLFNKCSGEATVCTNEIELTGTYNKLVIQGTNECRNGATCTNIIRITGSYQSLRFKVAGYTFEGTKIKNFCDSSSVCSTDVL